MRKLEDLMIEAFTEQYLLIILFAEASTKDLLSHARKTRAVSILSIELYGRVPQEDSQYFPEHNTPYRLGGVYGYLI
jgi:hypothetical protein